MDNDKNNSPLKKILINFSYPIIKFFSNPEKHEEKKTTNSLKFSIQGLILNITHIPSNLFANVDVEIQILNS